MRLWRMREALRQHTALPNSSRVEVAMHCSGDARTDTAHRNLAKMSPKSQVRRILCERIPVQMRTEICMHGNKALHWRCTYRHGPSKLSESEPLVGGLGQGGRLSPELVQHGAHAAVLLGHRTEHFVVLHQGLQEKKYNKYKQEEEKVQDQCNRSKRRVQDQYSNNSENNSERAELCYTPPGPAG